MQNFIYDVSTKVYFGSNQRKPEKRNQKIRQQSFDCVWRSGDQKVGSV